MAVLKGCSRSFGNSSKVESLISVKELFIFFSKSAQFPFSSWLLNAMSAPTPISALLHSSTMAFDSVYYIMIDVNVGWLIRWLHCLGASLFMLFILIHWIRGAWIRLKVIDLQAGNLASLSLIWVSGWVILSCSMIEGFLGYILNWGQMSYWGIIVMINLLSIIAELIWCSCNVIINRIFVLHFSLGFLIGCLIFVHLFVLHSFSSSNPLLNSCSSLMIPFFPLFMNDCFVSESELRENELIVFLSYCFPLLLFSLWIIIVYFLFHILFY